MTELKVIGDYLVSYQRQGNDKNGNPIYIINVFSKYYPGYPRGYDTEWVYSNDNYTWQAMTKGKLDKYGNIKIQSYNISDSIARIIQQLK